MPYITQEDRKKFFKILKLMPTISNKGELEYCIAVLQHRYMSTKVWSYTELHSAVYAAIHAGDEFRRRFLDKREDSAIIKNGDIEW